MKPDLFTYQLLNRKYSKTESWDLKRKFQFSWLSLFVVIYEETVKASHAEAVSNGLSTRCRNRKVLLKK